MGRRMAGPEVQWCIETCSLRPLLSGKHMGTKSATRYPVNRSVTIKLRHYQEAVSEARVKPYRGPPATLGSTAPAGLTLVVWCNDCRHQVEPDPAEMAERYGAETTVPA